MPEPHRFSGPLYEQVRGLILSRIQAGDWRAGTPIPAEVQLSRDFGVSIGTVRKALDQLARDRILVRERGRGTFVKDAGGRREGLWLRVCDATGAAVQAEIVLVAVDYAIATVEEVGALRIVTLPSIVPRILKVHREWRNAAELLCVETIMVDAARFPNLQFEANLTSETLFRLYADRYHASVDRTTWTVKPISNDDPCVGTINKGPDATVMRCVRTAFDARDVPIELSEQMLIFDGELALSVSQ